MQNSKSQLIPIGNKILGLKDLSVDLITHKTSGEWETLRAQDYYLIIEKIAGYLFSLGAKSGTPIAIIGQTQLKWAACDLAILGSRGLTVAIYPNSTEEDISYILNHSETQFAFVEDGSQGDWLKAKASQFPKLKAIIPWSSWEDVLKKGELFLIESPGCFQESCAQAQISDPATLIYTSGTTGAPKGVLLTQEQLASEVQEAFPLFGVSKEDVSLSFLPYAHILGRIDHWGSVYFHYRIAFAESLERIKNNLQEIHPTFFIAVPRIFEKIYSAILAQMESDTLQKNVFQWAQRVGDHHTNVLHRGLAQSLWAWGKTKIAQALVFDRIQEVFGGRLRFAVCGGAPFAAEIARFFERNGVKILEGYGLTETTAAITVNPPYHSLAGTVGLPIGDVKIRLAQDGEILIQSKKTMREYYKDPEQTHSLLQDNWFATGDIGELLPSGHLRIVDRKKDLIKTAGGKYVAPQKLEGLLKSHPLIGPSIIHGDQRKYVVALLTLDKEAVTHFAKSHNLAYSDWQELTENSLIQKEVRSIVTQVNSELASFESIKKFTVLNCEFTVEGGELTPSLKVKRKALEKRYHKELESLYSHY